jgi:hypothetical protein
MTLYTHPYMRQCARRYGNCINILRLEHVLIPGTLWMTFGFPYRWPLLPKQLRSFHSDVASNALSYLFVHGSRLDAKKIENRVHTALFETILFTEERSRNSQPATPRQFPNRTTAVFASINRYHRAWVGRC